MPRITRLLGRRAGPWGMAFMVWDLWRRIPPKQRQRLMAEARKHGPRIAREAAARSRQRRRP